MADVALVFPYFDDGRSKSFKFPPLGIGYIASYLRTRGFTPEVVDCTFLTKEEALRKIIAAKPRVTGIYSMLSMVNQALDLAKALREHCDFLVAGGPMPSAYPQKFLGPFDAVAVGEAEETMAEIMEAVEGGGTLDNVKGLHLSKQAIELYTPVARFANGGSSFFTGQRPLRKDLDSFPFPARDLYENDAYRKYYQKYHNYTMTSMIASRGCPFCCDFCVTEDTLVVGNPALTNISEVQTGTKVLTHTSSFREVTWTFKRRYGGEMLHIKPWLVGPGVKITPEHQVLAIPADGISRRGKGVKVILTPEFVSASLLGPSDYLCIPIPTSTRSLARLSVLETLRRESLDITYQKKNLLPQETVRRIFDLYEQGYSKRAISKVLGIKRETAAKYLREQPDPTYPARLHVSKYGIRYTFARKWAPSSLRVTFELCRLIGYYLAEGDVTHRPRRPNSVTIQFTFGSHERELVGDTTRLIRKCLKIEPRIAENAKNKTNQIQVNSAVLGRFFELTFGRDSTDKHLPHELLQIPRRLQSEIIRGLFLGDGYSRKGEFTFKTSSKVLASQVYLILLRLKVASSIHVRTAGQKGRTPHYAFSMKGEAWAAISKVLGMKVAAKRTRSNLSIFYKNYLLVPIRQIKKLEFDGEVYNLSVKEDETYTANFLAVHNCWRPEYGRYYRVRSPENIVDEMEEIVYRYGYHRIWFADELFIANKKHVIKICEEIVNRRLDVKWECLARADIVDHDVARAMRKAGCHKVIFGLESGDDRVLKLMNKKITVAQSRNAVKVMSTNEIKIGAFFIFGYPGETNETMLNTIKFISSLPLDYFSMTVPYPLPGTPLYERVKDKMTTDEWEKPVHGYDHKLLFKHDFTIEKLKYGMHKANMQSKLRQKLGPAYYLVKPWEWYSDYKFKKMN